MVIHNVFIHAREFIYTVRVPLYIFKFLNTNFENPSIDHIEFFIENGIYHGLPICGLFFFCYFMLMLVAARNAFIL